MAFSFSVLAFSLSFIPYKLGILNEIDAMFLKQAKMWRQITYRIVQLFTKIVLQVVQTLNNLCKVHIFWEDHKILRNLHLTFVLCSASQK